MDEFSPQPHFEPAPPPPPMSPDATHALSHHEAGVEKPLSPKIEEILANAARDSKQIEDKALTEIKTALASENQISVESFDLLADQLEESRRRLNIALGSARNPTEAALKKLHLYHTESSAD